MHSKASALCLRAQDDSRPYVGHGPHQCKQERKPQPQQPLPQACTEAGVSAAGVLSTAAGRDGMFSAGARAALDAAAAQNGAAIDGEVPERFVSELAHVLGA